MMGEPSNDAPGSFWTASVEEAAEKLAAILREENADVLTHYDDHGFYGHPDHIQVHRVGTRAAELAGTKRVYQSTGNRDRMRAGRIRSDDENTLDFDETIGTPEAELTTSVDVAKYVTTKRAAMRTHASQISDQSFFLSMSDDMFELAFGTEWFIRVGAEPGITEHDIMADLD
jgi:LmbE family N-acetylglucosaminyl deacetylase